MMTIELINNIWIILTLVAAIAACIGIVLLTAWIKQICKRQSQRDDEYSALQNTINLLSQEMIEAKDGQQQLEFQFKNLQAQRLQLRTNDHDTRPYSNAIKMVQKGASVEDLVSICGLSKNEAELISTIHGTSQSSSKDLWNEMGLV